MNPDRWMPYLTLGVIAFAAVCALFVIVSGLLLLR
jgi:hypothetical protein